MRVANREVLTNCIPTVWLVGRDSPDLNTKDSAGVYSRAQRPHMAPSQPSFVIERSLRLFAVLEIITSLLSRIKIFTSVSNTARSSSN
jgi:hypothetical protein